ncbi:MAG TPA: DUF5680 domain-containing protein [Candidatus Paceibacterota bacterium]
MNNTQKGLEVIQNESWFKRHAEQFFYEAMLRGYAGSSTKGESAELPGSRTIEFKDGSWRILDLYMVSAAGPGSGGTTTLWYEDIPIWMMQYVGQYEERAIPCLKAALAKAYGSLHFEGGRGPKLFFHDGLHYVNESAGDGFFGHSYGREFIYIPEGEYLGFHRYQSQWLTKGLW